MHKSLHNSLLMLQLRHRAICNNLALEHPSSTGRQVRRLLRSEDCASIQVLEKDQGRKIKRFCLYRSQTMFFCHSTKKCLLTNIITIYCPTPCLLLRRKDYTDFARLCFEHFGDKVKHWFTFNKPHTFCCFAYGTGEHACPWTVLTRARLCHPIWGQQPRMVPGASGSW
jgi:hypothetical protein